MVILGDDLKNLFTEGVKPFKLSKEECSMLIHPNEMMIKKFFKT